MHTPCYQHDSYDSRCNDCREMNGVPLVGAHDTLHLSSNEYSEMLEQRAKLTRLTIHGREDWTQFTAWAMRRFNLEPYVCYKIVVGK